MKIQLKIVSALKTISHWNNEKGANVDESGVYQPDIWHGDAVYLKGIVKQYSSMEELKLNAEKDFKKYLTDNMYTDVTYLNIMDDGRIDTNLIEDSESNPLNIDERIDFHKNKKPMYICDYSLKVEIQNVYEPDVSELNGLFPSAVQE